MTTSKEKAPEGIPAPLYEFFFRAGGHRNVLRYLMINGVSREDAEEISTDVLLSAITHYESLTDPTALTPWIWAITRNKLIDQLRRHYRSQQEIHLDDEAWDYLAETIPTHSGEDSFRLEVDSQQLYQAIERLGKLHPEKAAALELFLTKNWTISELAGHLGRTVSTTRSLIASARKELRSIILGMEDEA